MEAKSDIECSVIKHPDDPILNQVETTYNDSFPLEERRPFVLVKKLLESNPYFKLYIINKEGSYAGFITLWDFDTFCYVEHFAIDSNARNGGIGAKTVECIKTLVQKPVVLEVELPTDELSKRRIGFYERQGFTLDSHIYFQPPYHDGGAELEMRLMSTVGIDLEKEFEEVKRIIHTNVYNR